MVKNKKQTNKTKQTKIQSHEAELSNFLSELAFSSTERGLALEPAKGVRRVCS